MREDKAPPRAATGTERFCTNPGLSEHVAVVNASSVAMLPGRKEALLCA